MEYRVKMSEGMTKTIVDGIFAGAAIGIGGFINLALQGQGQGEFISTVAGAIFFTFGLLTVIYYKLALFTGKSGCLPLSETGTLVVILVANFVGTLILSLLARISPMADTMQAIAQKIMTGRLNCGYWQCGVLAIGCGFIVEEAVNAAKKSFYIPMIFGVPAFIFCGFPHCVADAFYLCASPLGFIIENIVPLLIFYACIVLGNYVGCNLRRLFKLGEN